MDTAVLLDDAFDRVRELVPQIVDGLTPEQLTARPDGAGTPANPIGWLVWHLARVQDDHVAGVAGTGQVWTDEGWVDRFGLDLPAEATGYGHDPDEVDKVRVTAELLTGYHAAVAARTSAYVSGLGPDDLDRVVDDRWDPPVTAGVRLVSVLGDTLEHAGQAAYVRGLLGA